MSRRQRSAILLFTLNLLLSSALVTWGALPNTLNSSSPADTDPASQGASQIRGVKQYLVDVFGVPNNSQITATAAVIASGGQIAFPQGIANAQGIHLRGLLYTAGGGSSALSTYGGTSCASGIFRALNGDGLASCDFAGAADIRGFPRGYLSGFTMSTAGSSSTMLIQPGQALDSQNSRPITLANFINKTTSAWSVGTGNGCLDTGSITTSTFYYFFVILRPDTNVVDILCSASLTAPSMPANYTYRRYVGAARTDSSSNWTGFLQKGDLFLWRATVEDVDATPNSAAAQGVSLTVPSGDAITALFRAHFDDATNAPRSIVFTSPDENDQAPSSTAAPGVSLVSGEGGDPGQATAGHFAIHTSFNSQIRYRMGDADADARIVIWTYGWIDRRGRDD